MSNSWEKFVIPEKSGLLIISFCVSLLTATIDIFYASVTRMVQRMTCYVLKKIYNVYQLNYFVDRYLHQLIMDGTLAVSFFYTTYQESNGCSGIIYIIYYVYKLL